MNAAWTLYNILVLSVAASVAWETRQRRADARVDVPVRVTLITEDGRRLAATARNLSRGGVAAHLATRARLQEGEFVVAAFEHEGSRCEIGARVARSSGATQHLTFAALGLREEAYLTSLIYSRPEAWLSWHTSRPVDRPLRSLLHVVLLGLRGLVFVPPLAVFSRRPVARRRRKRAPAVAALVPLLGLLTPARLDAAGQQAPRAAGRSRSTTFQEVVRAQRHRRTERHHAGGCRRLAESVLWRAAHEDHHQRDARAFATRRGCRVTARCCCG